MPARLCSRVPSARNDSQPSILPPAAGFFVTVASQLQQLSHTRHSLFPLHHHASSTCFRYPLPICQPTLPNATGFQPPKNRDALSPTSLPTEKKTGLCACCQHRRTCTFSAKVVGYPRTALATRPANPLPPAIRRIAAGASPSPAADRFTRKTEPAPLHKVGGTSDLRTETTAG